NGGIAFFKCECFAFRRDDANQQYCGERDPLSQSEHDPISSCCFSRFSLDRGITTEARRPRDVRQVPGADVRLAAQLALRRLLASNRAFASSNTRRVLSPSDKCSSSVSESHSLRWAAKKSPP